MSFSWQAGLAGGVAGAAGGYQTVLNEQRAEAAEQRKQEAITDREEHMLLLENQQKRQGAKDMASDQLAFKNTPGYIAQQERENQTALSHATAVEKAKFGAKAGYEDAKATKEDARVLKKKDEAWAKIEKQMIDGDATPEYISEMKDKFYKVPSSTPEVAGMSAKDANSAAVKRYEAMVEGDPEFNKKLKENGSSPEKYIAGVTNALMQKTTVDRTNAGATEAKTAQATKSVMMMKPDEEATFMKRVAAGSPSEQAMFDALPDAKKDELQQKHSGTGSLAPEPLSAGTPDPNAQLGTGMLMGKLGQSLTPGPQWVQDNNGNWVKAEEAVDPQASTGGMM